MDGLGLAETTPGPLILVTEFVGYLSAYRHGGGPAPDVLCAVAALPKPRMAATKSYRSSPKIDCITNALACVFEAPLSST